MKKIIVKSAYDDVVKSDFKDYVSGKPEYYVAHYKYETNYEFFEDINLIHKGWGKTAKEAIYNLLIQRTDRNTIIYDTLFIGKTNGDESIYDLIPICYKKQYDPVPIRYKKIKLSKSSKTLFPRALLLLLAYGLFIFLILKDFGTFASLEWLIIGIFLYILRVFYKKEKSNNEEED